MKLSTCSMLPAGAAGPQERALGLRPEKRDPGSLERASLLKEVEGERPGPRPHTSRQHKVASGQETLYFQAINRSACGERTLSRLRGPQRPQLLSLTALQFKPRPPETCLLSKITILALRAQQVAETARPLLLPRHQCRWAPTPARPEAGLVPTRCTSFLPRPHHWSRALRGPARETPGPLLPGGREEPLRSLSRRLVPWLLTAAPGPRSIPPPRCPHPPAGCSGAVAPGQGWSPALSGA